MNRSKHSTFDAHVQVKSWFKFVTFRVSGSDLIEPAAERLEGMVGDWDSADLSRSVANLG
jgi:hypothetical protein